MTHKNIYEALAAAQGEIDNPTKSKTAKAGSYSYNYADIADVLKCILPALSKHGIAVAQPTEIIDGNLVIRTVLYHQTGEGAIESIYPVCSVNQADHQKMGAAMTYARRYALCSMVGVAAEDDLDGKDAAKTTGGAKRMSAHQAKKEVNWDSIVSAIRSAKTEKLLDNMSQRVTDNEGVWPDSYVTSAREEIAKRHEELSATTLGYGKDPITPWDDYDSKIEAIAATLKDAPADIQAEIFEAESLEMRHEAGMIFPPDYERLKGLLKAA